MAPSIPQTDEHFVTPVECSEMLLDSAGPQADNSFAISQPLSPRAQIPIPPLLPPPPPLSPAPRSESRGLRSRSSTVDSVGSNSVVLDRIEFVDISKKVKRGGVNYYVVDVYKRRSGVLQRSSESAYSATVASRLSGADMLDIMLREREPDYQVEHRFAAFRELKNTLQRLANQHAEQCAHCRTLLAYLMHGNNQSWSIKRLVKTSASRQELLSKFVNGVLSLTSESDTNNRVCLVNDKVTETVERFLRRRYAPSLGII